MPERLKKVEAQVKNLIVNSQGIHDSLNRLEVLVKSLTKIVTVLTRLDYSKTSNTS
jgi:archaellum component FlaC